MIFEELYGGFESINVSELLSKQSTIDLFNSLSDTRLWLQPNYMTHDSSHFPSSTFWHFKAYIFTSVFFRASDFYQTKANIKLVSQQWHSYLFFTPSS